MIEEIKIAWKDLLAFLRHPTREHYPGVNTAQTSKRLLAILVIDIGLSLIALSLISVVSALELVDLENHAVEDMMNDFGPLAIVGLAVLLGPAIEELIFRGPLAFGTRPMRPAGASPDDIHELMDAPVASGWEDDPTASVVAAGTTVADHTPSTKTSPFIFFLYGLTLAFAYLHIFNFQLDTTILLLSPVLVLAQFLLGLLAAYMGTRFGWLWAYALHAIHNLIFVGGALIAQEMMPDDMLDTPTEELIEEHNSEGYLPPEEGTYAPFG